MEATKVKSWMEQVIRPEEYEKYLDEDGRDFIHEDEIESLLNTVKSDASRVREIIAKSEEIQILTLEECAVLLNVEDPGRFTLPITVSITASIAVFVRKTPVNTGCS